MTKSEVAKLFERIVQYYHTFTGDRDKILAWHEILENVSFDEAIKNLKRHASTTKFPPVPAELISPKKTEIDRYHDFMHAEGALEIEKYEQQREKAVGPTPEQKRRVRESLGIDV